MTRPRAKAAAPGVGLIGAVALVVLSGCATEWDAFSAQLTNERSEPVRFNVTIEREPGRESFLRSFDVPAESSLVETWRLKVDRYHVTATAADLEANKTLRVCASYRLEVAVNETRIGIQLKQGDGWAGC